MVKKSYPLCRPVVGTSGHIAAKIFPDHPLSYYSSCEPYCIIRFVNPKSDSAFLTTYLSSLGADRFLSVSSSVSAVGLLHTTRKNKLNAQHSKCFHDS
jgi:hypothetical protein